MPLSEIAAGASVSGAIVTAAEQAVIPDHIEINLIHKTVLMILSNSFCF
jgi:hypothetical protein